MNQKQKSNTESGQWVMNTEIGKIYLIASDHGLQGLHFEKKPVPVLATLNENRPLVKILARTVKQLEEYFKGKRREFDLPFDIGGTEFQRKVWNQLARIPYGKTCSYTDVAKKIKNDNAVRAVGTANGRNPLLIIVPCHRVVAADGTLGGYTAGLAIKKILLALEKNRQP